jgi:hypothetical protein
MTITQERISAAIAGALVSRGRAKGRLKASCPAMGTDAAAAWQALTMQANPYKIGLGHLIFMPAEQRELFEAIKAGAERLDIRGIDRDRVALESLGVW